MKIYSGLAIILASFGAATCDSAGHVHSAPLQNFAQTSSVTNQRLSRSAKCGSPNDLEYMRSSLEDIDYQMRVTLSSLPQAISEARSAVESGTLESNRDKLLVGIFCFIGALSGSLGILYNKDILALSQADQIYLASMNLWGYGYYGPFLFELSETDPGCGVQDFNRVVYEYSFVTSLDQVYGSNPTQSNNPDDSPELRRYYLGEFSRKLKLALHCITSQKESVEEARKVVSLIDKYVALANQRIDYTINLLP